MNNKFLINTMFVYALQGTNILAPLIVLPYLARVLGIHDYGMVSLFVSICGIAFIVNDYGFSLCGTYWISKSRNNKLLLNMIISSIYKIKGFIFLLSMVALLLYFYNSNLNFSFFFIINVAGVVLFQSFQPIWYFQGIEKMRLVTLYVLISRICFVISVLLLVKNSNDINYVYISYCVSNIIACFISNHMMYRNGVKRVKTKTVLIKYCLLNAFGFFLSRASLSIYSTASTFIIGNFVSIQQAALYSSAEKIYQASQGISGPLTQALLPRLASNKDHSFFIRLLKIALLPIFMISFIGYIYSDSIINFVFGSEFHLAAEPLKLFFIIFSINFINTLFGYPAFAIIKKINIVNYTVILGALVQLLLLSILAGTQSLSVNNVVRSIMLTEIVVTITRIILYLYFRKTAMKEWNR